MKKLLAVLLAAVCLLTACVLPAAADNAYIESFEELVNSIRFFNKTPSGQTMNAQTVYNYITHILCGDDTYATARNEYGDAVEYTIPAADFEDYALGMFAIDQSMMGAVRQLTYTTYDSETQTNKELPCYDEATASYKAGFQGGMGDPSKYICQGYTAVGANRYEAYLTLYDYSEEEPRIIQHVKWLFEYTGEAFRYVSWAQIDAIPDSGLITPSTTTTTESTTTTTTQKSSTTTGSTTSTKKPTTTTTTSRWGTTSKRPTVAIDGVLKVWYETEEVRLQASESAFLKGTELVANPLREGATFDRVSAVLEETALQFVAYDITAMWNEAAVQPGDTVEAIFTIPEGWNHDALEVVYISEDFDIEKLDYTLDSDAGTVLIAIDHFSLYALIQRVDKLAGPVEKNVPVGAIVGLVAGALVLIGLAVYTVLLILRQRGAAPAATPAADEPVVESAEPETPTTDPVAKPEEKAEDTFPVNAPADTDLLT